MLQLRDSSGHNLVRVAALLLSAGLGSCAQHTVPNYSPIFTGPSARLLMRAQLAPREIYGVYSLAGTDDCSKPQLVGTGNATKNPTATVIAAGKMNTLDILVLKPDNGACKLRWSFVPKANHSYLVNARSLTGGCAALILDATDPDNISPEQSALRRNYSGQKCVPLSSSLTYAQLEARGKDQADQELPTSTQPTTGTPQPLDDADLKALTGL
jgi:hypothetical protein